VNRVQCPISTLLRSTSNKSLHDLNGIQISKWMGRLGNNVQQLAHAFVYAERTGLSCVMTPEPDDLAELFHAPEVFMIQPASSHSSGCILHDNTGHEIRHDDNREADWFFIHCEGVHEDHIHDVLTKYLMPLKNKDFSTSLAEKVKARLNNSLTVYLRSGDVFNVMQKHECHRQPPCALYDDIFKKGSDGKPFQHMQLVMDAPKAGENSNPCKDFLLNRLGDRASYSEGSLVQDASKIMSSEYLVAGFSTFSLYLALMSPSLKTIFVSNPATGGQQNPAEPNYFPFDRGCSPPPGVALVRYTIADQEKYRPVARDNIDWMLAYNNIPDPDVCVPDDRD